MKKWLTSPSFLKCNVSVKFPLVLDFIFLFFIFLINIHLRPHYIIEWSCLLFTIISHICYLDMFCVVVLIILWNKLILNQKRMRGINLFSIFSNILEILNLFELEQIKPKIDYTARTVNLIQTEQKACYNYFSPIIYVFKDNVFF